MKAHLMARRDDLTARSAKPLGALLLVLSSAWSGTASAADARPSKPAPAVVRDTADEWFDKGSSAYDAHRLQDAETAFLEA